MLSEPAAIIEADVERDRRACINLFHRVTGANRELAQWLLDHPRYSGAQVAEWLDCSAEKIKQLRRWAKDGMPGNSPTSGKERERYKGNGNRRRAGDAALKSQENSDDEQEEDEGEQDNEHVASPEEIRKNILDSVERQVALVRSYNKILKVSSLDQIMKNEISTALGKLILKCQSLQRVMRSRR